MKQLSKCCNAEIENICADEVPDRGSTWSSMCKKCCEPCDPRAEKEKYTISQLIGKKIAVHCESYDERDRMLALAGLLTKHHFPKTMFFTICGADCCEGCICINGRAKHMVSKDFKIISSQQVVGDVRENRTTEKKLSECCNAEVAYPFPVCDTKYVCQSCGVSYVEEGKAIKLTTKVDEVKGLTPEQETELKDIVEGPMGVSQWMAHGKKYGYDKYFKLQFPDIRETLEGQEEAKSEDYSIETEEGVMKEFEHDLWSMYQNDLLSECSYNILSGKFKQALAKAKTRGAHDMVDLLLTATKFKKRGWVRVDATTLEKMKGQLLKQINDS